MVNIDSFEFQDGYTKLVAVVSVPDRIGYEDVYIQKVIIGTQDTYDTENNTFSEEYFNDESKKIGTLSNVTTYINGLVYYKEDADEKGPLTLILRIDNDNIKLSDLFFIQVITSGTYGENIGCEGTGDTWSSTYDEFSINAKGMQYIRELANSCETPEGLIDYILNKEAMDVAKNCGDYSTMITRYNELNGTAVTTSGKVSNYKACGCYG